LISERVFVAFDTGRGLAYVQASGWQRAYLLWTFRNFRDLPHKILNARQRELVETLYAAASTNLANTLDEATLIGTVEDLILPFAVQHPVAVATEESAASIPAVSMAAASAPAKNNGATSSWNLSQHLQAICGPPGFFGLARTVGAWALVAIMAVLCWQQLRSRPVVVSASTAKQVANQGQTRAIGQARIASPTNTNAQPPTQIASATQTTVTAALAPGATGNQTGHASKGTVQSPEQASEQISNKRIPTQVEASGYRTVTDQATLQESPRMQISGQPRKIIYPDCPDSARGIVSLQAFVGYDGAVNRVRALTGNRVLAAAATKAIRQWRYQPFSGDAQKLEREARITISFISSDVVAVSFPRAPVSQ